MKAILRPIVGTVMAGLVAMFCSGPLAAQSKVKVDEKLADYKAVAGISGNLKSVGSDTMNETMQKWAEGFAKFYPNVKVEIEGKGSATGPPALTGGTCQFAPMSRAMKPKEIDEFKSKFGYPPIPLSTSIDMLAVYVHKDNPIKGLTFQQIDAIFSKTRKGGHATPINTWGDLGLDGDWKAKPIALYGRNAASGTYQYFREHALFGGDYRNEVKELPGTSAVVQAVAGDKYGIGYGGIGYKTADVRALPLAKESEFVPAEAERAYSGEYPLARSLFLYVNCKKNGTMDPLRTEFVRYVFSKQGQLNVVSSGYLPITNEDAKEALRSVGVKN